MPQAWSEFAGLDPADMAACQARLKQGSRSFHAAARLLPGWCRQRAVALYAFCRLADDRVDLGPGDARVLERLRERLDAVYADRPWPDPADRALAAFVRATAMPRELPDALLEGLAWDIEGRHYERLTEVQAYAARVAGSVGAMMALAIGVRDSALLARACDLGVAMQLTNIARDVGEDARAGRLYLPRAWLREAGVDPDRFLAEPAHGPGLARVIRRLLVVADRLYVRADPGISALPRGCRPGIAAARLVYSAIGEEIERAGGDAVSRRAVVPARKKIRLAALALTAPLPGSDPIALPALAETRFLVDAVEASHLPVSAARPAAAPATDGWLSWVIELFLRLEQRQSLESGARPMSENDVSLEMQ